MSLTRREAENARGGVVCASDAEANWKPVCIQDLMRRDQSVCGTYRASLSTARTAGTAADSIAGDVTEDEELECPIGFDMIADSSDRVVCQDMASRYSVRIFTLSVRVPSKLTKDEIVRPGHDGLLEAARSPADRVRHGRVRGLFLSRWLPLRAEQDRRVLRSHTEKANLLPGLTGTAVQQNTRSEVNGA